MRGTLAQLDAHRALVAVVASRSVGYAAAVRKQSAGNLAWIDLEMTGLDPDRDTILQAALIVTSADLDVLEEASFVVWQPAAALEVMTPFVRRMHETTGLLDKVAASTDELRAVEKALIERIAGWCPYPAMLAGNSIGYDRRFIDRHMPGLAGYLHYRMIDVSAVKVLAELWYGKGAIFPKPKAGKHDAVVDVKNSIAELAHYRKTLFRER